MVGFEWKICLTLFSWNIFGTFTLSGILSQFDETDGELILVHIEASGRSKRSTDGNLHPDHFNLDFSVSGTEVQLLLHRNDRLTTNVPTLLFKNNHMRYERPTVPQNDVFYQDTLNGGSFLVNFNRDKTETIYGVFQSNGKEYILQSNETKEEQQHRNGFRKFQIKTARSMKVNDDVIKGVTDSTNKMNLNSNKLNNNRRQKRATGSYSVELLIVVDYAIYQRWYQKSTGSTLSEREANTIQSVRQFYAFIINGMDDMYKNIQTSSFTINILFAGIIIAQTANDAPWTETIKIQSVVPNQVEATSTLNKFGDWVKAQTNNIPGHDHAMLFTGYEMINAGSTVIAGYAVTSAVCTVNSISVVEDKFNFMMITVAAHELGHSLGANHDGTGNNCFASNAYIMTSTSIPQTSTVTASNPWKFSTCSTTYFNNYINTLITNSCLKTLSPTYNPNALQTERQLLPGQLYNADEQCANIVGAGSVMCRQQYNGDYSTICNILWCRTLDNLSNCRSHITGDGTQCGDKQWCKTGVCTSSNNAPSGSATCLYGDQRGVVFGNGWSCADMILAGPHNCATAQVAVSCCASCAPSTVAPPTTTTTTPTTTTTTRVTTTPPAVGSTSVPTQTTDTTPVQTTVNTANDQEFMNIIRVVGVAAGASVIVLIIIVSMVCCCCNRKPKPKKTRSINRNQLSYIRHSQPQNGYVNRAMVYEQATKQPVQKVQRPGSIVVRQPAPKVQRQYRY